MASTYTEQIAAIVAAANRLAPKERDSYLVRVSQGDSYLLDRLRTMTSAVTADLTDLDRIQSKDSSAPVRKDILSERTTIDFSDPDKLVGQKLDGRFLIEKNLTDKGGDPGGIGVVYIAKDVKLMNKDVVVKILNETALKHPDIVRKFEHEKEALIRLDHPNIVRILDSGKLRDGNPFMVMDFIKGHSLRKAILRNNKVVRRKARTKPTRRVSSGDAELHLFRNHPLDRRGNLRSGPRTRQTDKCCEQ